MSVLGAVTVPAVSSYTRKAELSVAKENLRQAHNAVMMVRELGEITTPPQKYAYTDVEDDSEFSALMKKYLNVKYYDRSTGKGTKLIFLNWSKPGKKNEIRIWFELGNGDRVKLKNGNIEGVFESDAPTGMYLKKWGYRTHGDSIYN